MTSFTGLCIFVSPTSLLVDWGLGVVVSMTSNYRFVWFL